MTGANVSYGKEGVYYNEISGDVSNSTQLRGANLDIDGSGVNAGFDSLRTGGVRVNNVEGRNDIGGVTTDYSLGEFSNDMIFEGANLGHQRRRPQRLARPRRLRRRPLRELAEPDRHGRRRYAVDRARLVQQRQHHRGAPTSASTATA